MGRQGERAVHARRRPPLPLVYTRRRRAASKAGAPARADRRRIVGDAAGRVPTAGPVRRRARHGPGGDTDSRRTARGRAQHQPFGSRTPPTGRRIGPPNARAPAGRRRRHRKLDPNRRQALQGGGAPGSRRHAALARPHGARRSHLDPDHHAAGPLAALVDPGVRRDEDPLPDARSPPAPRHRARSSRDPRKQAGRFAGRRGGGRHLQQRQDAQHAPAG